MGGNRHIHHLLDHEKYGTRSFTTPSPFPLPYSLSAYLTSFPGQIVRIGPNTLSFNTSTALSTIYGPQKTNVCKSEWYRTVDAGSGAFSIGTEIDKQRHIVRRRFIAQCFSTNTLKEAEEFILAHVKKFCEVIAPREGEWREKKNVSAWCTWMAFDVMGDLAFGKKFDCLEKEDNRYISRAIMSANKYMYWVSRIY